MTTGSRYFRAGRVPSQLIAIVLLAVAAVLFWAIVRKPAVVGPPSPLTPLKDVPAFSLQDQNGKTVNRDDLLGFVWVADFIFTSCTGPCPTLSLRMRSLQQDIEKFGGKVKLVSFSVDPLFDRPAVLRQYAEAHHAKADLWWFLTGDSEEQLHTLVRDGFLQALSPAGAGSPIIHSTRFVIVDRQGRIRAWHDGLEAESKPLILRDVERLLSEPPQP